MRHLKKRALKRIAEDNFQFLTDLTSSDGALLESVVGALELDQKIPSMSTDMRRRYMAACFEFFKCMNRPTQDRFQCLMNLSSAEDRLHMAQIVESRKPSASEPQVSFLAGGGNAGHLVGHA
jgi:hypothetical protein